MVGHDFQYSSAPSLPLFTPSKARKDSTSTLKDTRPVHAASRSRSSSVWTAPSPGQAVRSRSPSLPPLPQFASHELRSQSYQSPVQHQKSDSSTYYTAVWGSPYDLPSSSKAHLGRYHHERAGSIITADGSPLRNSRTREVSSSVNIPAQPDLAKGSQCIDSSASHTFEQSLASSKSGSIVQKPRYGFTQDWLRTHLADRKISEKGYWWSDESGASDAEPVDAKNLITSPEENLSSPAIKRGSSKQRATITAIEDLTSSHELQDDLSGLSNHRARSIKSHGATPSDVTLRQQDFDQLFGVNRGEPPTANMLASSHADPAVVKAAMTKIDTLPATEKPLPPAPINRTASEAPVIMSATETSPSGKRPSIASTMSFQRSKKRVIWRGKTCVIALPLDDVTDSNGEPKDYLRLEQVEQCLAEWESKGFDTRGFDLSEQLHGDIAPLGQSRNIYPNPHDWHMEWQNRIYRVSIPDKKAWDGYVTRLNEEKLRALGVSFGDEEVPLSQTISPNVMSMSRQASSQNSMLPPSLHAASSTTSPRMYIEKMYSPLSAGTMNPYSSPSPIISPGSQQFPIRPGSYHFQKQSVSFHSDQNLATLSRFQQQQPTPPISGAWSQQPHFSSLPVSRGVSPLVGGPRQTLRSVESPVSPMPEGVTPFNSSNLESYFAAQNNPPSISRHTSSTPHTALSQAPYQQMQQPFKSPDHFVSAEDSSEHGDSLQPMRYISQPEIASPLPQGHRHNLSETLQKEIDDNNYHLEESIPRQIDEDDDTSFRLSKEDELSLDLPRVNGNRITHGFYDGEDRSKSNPSDFDTNPSVTGSPRVLETESKEDALSRAHARHVPKPSVSKLNVNAQEFVYNPKKPSTNMFAFSGNAPSSVQFPNRNYPVIQTSNPTNTSERHTFSSNLNVAAPEFRPSDAPKPLMPSSRVFSFSSSYVPGLKPDAPSFKPSATSSDQSGSDQAAPKIFGNINISDILLPSKNSKAIPIVKPIEILAENVGDSDGQEDESGRITQADGRHKRMRRNDDDRDEVPLFATPSRDISGEPSSGPTLVLAPLNPAPPTCSVTEEKMVSPIGQATDQLKELVEELEASESSSSADGNGAKSLNDKLSESFEFDNAEDAATFNAARPTSVSSTSSSSLKDTDKENTSLPMDDILSLPKETQNWLTDFPPKQSIKPTLSATAKPFEYNPSDARITQLDFDVPEQVTAPLFSAGSLEASRYTVQLPSPQLPPVVVDRGVAQLHPRSSEKSSPVKVSLKDGVEYFEPSFQEIDAVMKHLNAEDSDLGLDRNENLGVDRNASRSPALTASRSPALTATRSSHRSRSRTPRTATPNSHLSDQGLSETRRHLRTEVQEKIPSASPNRLQQPFQYLPDRSYGSSDSAAAELVAQNARFSPSFKAPRHAEDHPITRLNRVDDLPISDWDDAVSSIDEAKIQMRSGFFDNKVNDLIGSVVQQRLLPLEKNIADISASLAQLASRSASRRLRRSVSADVLNSDADDEDDEEGTSGTRPLSPLRDRKSEKLKTSILENLASQQAAIAATESARVTETLASIKTVVEDAITRQMRGKSAPVVSSHESATAEKYQLQISGLETMLNVAEDRAGDESRARRLAEEALTDSQRLLRVAQSDAAEQRESAEETERSLRTFHDERLKAVQRTMLLEAAQEELQKTVSDLSAKNSALEDTLEEYRLSSDEWREEIEETKTENKNLSRTIGALKEELEEGIRGRQVLRTKFDRLQDDMTTAARNIARDQSSWRHNEEQHKARYELQSARLEAEARTRERLELEIERLEAQEKEAMKARFLVEQVQGENGRLVTLVSTLKTENDACHTTATDLQRQLYDAQETGKLDMQRVQSAMEVDMERAGQELKLVRADLESTIARLQLQLEDARNDTATTKSRYELMLEEASESKHNALREAAESREAALQEHYRFHERTLGDMKVAHEKTLESAAVERQHTLNVSLKQHTLNNSLLDKQSKLDAALQEKQRVIEDKEREIDAALEDKEYAIAEKQRLLDAALEDNQLAIAGKQRALEIALEDKQRAIENALLEKQLVEKHFNDRHGLVEEKVLHYQDRVSHLEEKLEIAKSAAQAAVQAAQIARATSSSPSSQSPMLFSRGSDVPDKISPQALRESIMVLQEQLHEREGQIEKLEQELEKVDKDAPTKIKERDIEISWLRELLGVRVDDLQDIIKTLQEPEYDQEAVRDAAIRLEANLQMEKQEKERMMVGGQTFPSLPSISNLAASPRSLPLAAAAAWGNWRRGQPSFGSLSGIANGSTNQTPSKSSPQSFLSGLMTPPSTTLRQTPQPTGSRRSSDNRPLRQFSTPKRDHSRLDPIRLQTEPPPTTPPLLRKASYDQDAESGHYSLARYVEEDESTVDDGAAGEEEPFGPRIEAARGTM